ncbi:hypothetical protein [Pseudomonas cremoricolorata]|uniref:Uncharacterized protein n=1 Tax=Pseudomonas cremoricolorata TaxID=157783 RepID=A0A089WNE3_9PSED|nr:hypothetical protein [Pseudomonas cremoricolorata]AIR90815.1 hypothetical protein LK03_16745 [Pseudomonas cremoricolorata]
MKRLLLCGLCALAVNAHGQVLSWADIRDGSLYLQPAQNDTVQVRWQPAWQADAVEESLYLLDGQGRLQGERPISRQQTRGEQDWPLAASAGPYQLEVPGYSFRRYSVTHDADTRALFAPAKVHFSVQAQPDTELYFQVPAGEQASLAGKYHGGVRALEVERLGDGRRWHLALLPHQAYWEFERLALPQASTPQVFRLRLSGQGKAAFWLDGSANLFAQRVEHLGPLAQREGQVHLRVGNTRRGSSARLGVNLPYLLPPKASHAVLDEVQPHAAGWYSFVDVLQRKPDYEQAFRRFYLQRYPIDQDITLLAATGRRSVLDAEPTTSAGLDAWLRSATQWPGHALHYLAFSDEPNLSYPDYASYARYFAAMLEQVQRFPGARDAGVRIAMPASSNLVNGPMREGSRERVGLDWARRLLAEHGEGIDALAWHTWMVRDLLATRSYRQQVRAAAELVGLDANGRPRKALLLDQTNISSGSSLSPYEQDTQFAALWWASVAINASADGLLDMLNWFQLADEPQWPKGMIQVHGEGAGFSAKPVALAHRFMQRHWLPEVLSLDNDAFEVDALAMAEGDQRSLLGVNKATRRQQLQVDGLGAACSRAQLQLLGADDPPRTASLDCHQGRAHFIVPGQTLFALTWQTADTHPATRSKEAP